MYPEKIIMREQQYKQVKAGTKTVTSWLTSDGVFHNTEAKAIKRQAEIDENQRRIDLWKTIKAKRFKDFDEFNVPDVFYLAETQEQLDLITEQMRSNRYDNHFVNGYTNHSLKVGDWIGHLYEDGGDYRDTYRWYTLEFLVNQMKKFVDFAERDDNVTHD